MGGNARAMCDHCERPVRVCLCDSLPKEKLRLSTHVLVFQHPHEAKRKIRSAVLLERCIDPSCLTIVRCRSLNALRTSKVWEKHVLGARAVPLLLFPSDSALSFQALRAARPTHAQYCLLVVDGTWKEANEMIRKSSKELAGISTVNLGLCPSLRARQGIFAARLPPRDGFISTLEAVAYAIKELEPEATAASTMVVLLRPLLRMSQQQLELTSNHGRQVSNGTCI